MSRKLAIIAAAVLTFTLTLAAVEVVSANPIIQPPVEVESPQNNKIYASNTVQLNFKALFGINYSSYYYILDNQPPKATNGTATLNDLSPGSHTLKIFGNGSYTEPFTNKTHEQHNWLLYVVYFSTVYSTAWVVFSVAMALVVIVAIVIPLIKRRQIATAFRGQKTAVFLLGAVLLLFGIIVCVPFAWQVANNYLFPHWPPRLLSVNPVLPLIASLILANVGLSLMWLGKRKRGSTSLPSSPTTKPV